MTESTILSKRYRLILVSDLDWTMVRFPHASFPCTPTAGLHGRPCSETRRLRKFRYMLTAVARVLMSTNVLVRRSVVFRAAPGAVEDLGHCLPHDRFVAFACW